MYLQICVYLKIWGFEDLRFCSAEVLSVEVLRSCFGGCAIGGGGGDGGSGGGVVEVWLRCG